MPETGQAVRARRVLVVADDPRTRRLVRDALTEAGHQVLVARSGPEALGLLDAGTPDLMLSTMDSDELATWTRLHAVPCLPLTIDGTAEAAVAVEEILARVAAGPTPPGPPPLPYPGTTLLTEARFVEELARAIERSGRSGRCGWVAALDLAERPSVAEQLGARADQDLRVQMSVLGAGAVEGSDRIALDTTTVSSRVGTSSSYSMLSVFMLLLHVYYLILLTHVLRDVVSIVLPLPLSARSCHHPSVP